MVHKQRAASKGYQQFNKNIILADIPQDKNSKEVLGAEGQDSQNAIPQTLTANPLTIHKTFREKT